MTYSSEGQRWIGEVGGLCAEVEYLVSLESWIPGGIDVHDLKKSRLEDWVGFATGVFSSQDGGAASGLRGVFSSSD